MLANYFNFSHICIHSGVEVVLALTQHIISMNFSVYCTLPRIPFTWLQAKLFRNHWCTMFDASNGDLSVALNTIITKTQAKRSIRSYEEITQSEKNTGRWAALLILIVVK